MFLLLIILLCIQRPNFKKYNTNVTEVLKYFLINSPIINIKQNRIILN